MCKDTVTGFMFGLSAGLFIGYFLKHYGENVPQASSVSGTSAPASKQYAAAATAAAAGR